MHAGNLGDVPDRDTEIVHRAVRRCGWTVVPMRNEGAPVVVRVVLQLAPGRRSRWQAQVFDHPVATGGGSLCFYVGPDIEGIRIEVPALSRLVCSEPQPVDGPPRGVWIAPRCHTLQRLHLWGVVQLQDVELTDDERWPLRATGSDPQIRLAPPRRRGTYRVHLDVELESGSSSPVAYCNDGAGYAAPSAVGFSRLGASSWTAMLNFSPTTREWRIDPTDQPGRFKLTDLSLERLGPAQRRRTLWSGAARLMRRLSGCWTVEDFRAEHELIELDGRRGLYESVGCDPFMRLRGWLPAGWYMAEVQLRLPAARGEAKFYPDFGQGEDEAQAMPLPLHSERLAKRLLHLSAPARLRFDPLAARGRFEIKHLRLVRVTPRFALSRLLRKLNGAHPRYRHQPARDGAASKPRLFDVHALWTDYASLFLRSGEGLVSYAQWIEEVETPRLPTVQRQQELIDGWTWHPLFSVVLPTWNTPPDLLRACLNSVLAQTYPHWELCIADDASTASSVRDVLREYERRDPRVKVAFRPVNGHIAAASNTALELARGDFVVLLDHDDLLAPHALFAVAQAVQERPSAQVLYSDEDKLDDAGQRCEPYFKPDWSPDLLYSQNYISHLGVYRRELVQRVGGFREGFEGSQDYDLVLRCVAEVANPQDIVHIPHVLYHWRRTPGSTARGHEQKDYASEAGRRALQCYFDTHHPGVSVSVVAPGIYRHRWPLPDPAPLVSLIVPTRDGLHILRNCIESLTRRTTYPHFEILVVDNQSTCPDTLAYLEALASGAQGGGRVRVLHYDQPFNYSAINNFAAAQARGTVLGLINNDIEVITPDWLTEMVSHAVRPDIGCVGAKLYYPDDTIQHAGVVLGIGGVANHALRGTRRGEPGYFGRLWTIYNPSAVTAAVLVLRKEIFERVGGLDAHGLPVAFNDVDLCLKVRQAGYRNLWTPHAELYHHESVSRGTDTSPEKRARFLGEVDVMLSRWGDHIARDPSYNPNLTLVREDYSLSLSPEAVPVGARTVIA